MFSFLVSSFSNAVRVMARKTSKQEASKSSSTGASKTSSEPEVSLRDETLVEIEIVSPAQDQVGASSSGTPLPAATGPRLYRPSWKVY